MSKNIAIIGGGASGLTAIKSCLEEGLNPVCFERTDHIGGLWHYTDTVTDDQACVMKSTVMNTSKEIMCFSDFPVPAEYPMYMHNSNVLQYFKSYASRFNAKRYIRFNTEILKLKEAKDFDTTGRWELTIKSSGTISTEVFDGVMICTGHHAQKQIPPFEGMKDFKGQIVHSMEYRTHVGYEDKRVLVVGLGSSGGDLAVELSRVASQVYVSTRGAWVAYKIFDNGYPVDLMLSRRSSAWFTKLIPYGQSLKTKLFERKLNYRFNHANYGLFPKHHFDQQHPTVNDDLPNRIACGSVVIKPDVRRFTTNGIEFVDGSRVDNIDTVILATGYKFGFPFVDHPALVVNDNEINLYKFVFPPDLERGTLAVIGCVQPVGSIMPISELQCRWATKVFKGERILPPKDDMMHDIQMKRTAVWGRYVRSPRHTMQVDMIPFMDELSREIGCLPDFRKLLWVDPMLTLRCIFGPFSPYQYRLMGPGKWHGAREAILTIWDRTLGPTRGTQRKEPTTTHGTTHGTTDGTTHGTTDGTTHGTTPTMAVFVKWLIELLLG